MRFSQRIIGVARWLLFPISFMYGVVIFVRNFLFDIGWLKSVIPTVPTICVGNVAVGGTGKTPAIEYLIRLLHTRYRIATLSRGYGRKTKGFVLADETATAFSIGDEPMQLYLNNKNNATIAVDEDRRRGIVELTNLSLAPEVILLDDALQHRKITALLNIVLTDYGHPFWRDFFLPVGNLRDKKNAVNRAGIIIVTKCPKNFSTKKRQEYIFQLKKYSCENIFFSAINYGLPYHLITGETIDVSASYHVLLVTGIANPISIINNYTEKKVTLETIKYKDHHIYSERDINYIIEKFENIKNRNKLVLVTEKDAVKLKQLNSIKNIHIPIYVLPIKMEILFGQEEQLNECILHSIGFKES